ncbi:MAG TPA: hypothetical protein VNI83_08150, partial [Vicinamibacterales bacterium]|nr:hypothetical protein [Vicinamibacterales bacterium]
AIVRGSRREYTCFAALARAAGRPGPVAAVPVRLGPGGIRAAALPPLSAHEQVKLDNALAAVAPA